jgi:tetratricopeptide (TPR) repeat protein
MVLRQEPDNGPALNGAGLALTGLGRSAEAGASFSRAISAAPENSLYRYNRALAFRGQQRLREALEDLDSILDRDPRFLEAVLQKAEVLHQLGMWDESMRTLETAGQFYPDHPELAFCRGVLLKSQGEPEGALRALDLCLARSPGHRRALSQKGLVLMELGRLDEAANCFDTVLEQGDNPEIAYRRACIYARQGLVQKAVQSLGMAAAHDPEKLLAARTEAAFDAVRESPSFRRLFKKYHLQ